MKKSTQGSNRGSKMVNTRNYLVRRINDGGRLVEGRSADDRRLPVSPLTYEEFIEGEKILKECLEKKEQMLQDDPEQKVSRIARLPSNPFHEGYMYFLKLWEKKIAEGSMSPETCVICGEKMDRNSGSEYPYCQDCGRLLMQGKVRSRNNTLGYLHWNQICIVCHQRKAHLNMKGMCRVCYRLGERHNTRDPEEIRKIRRDQLKKLIQIGQQLPSGPTKDETFFWGHSNWE